MINVSWSKICLFISHLNVTYDTLKYNRLLTQWGRVTHICVSNPSIIGSDNGLSPSRHQAIIWTNAGILLIRPSGTNFSEISIEIHIFSFTKMHFKWSSGKWRPFCHGLNVLTMTLQLLLLFLTMVLCVLKARVTYFLVLYNICETNCC